MDYVQKLLATNEKEVFRTHRHFFTIFGSLLKEIIVLVACIVGFFLVRTYTTDPFFFYIGIGVIALLAILSAFRDVLVWRSNEYIVTNRRVIHSRGIFSKNILDSSLNKINDVILQQSMFGRMFGYGTIKILTATDEVINLLDNIQNPIGFKHAMLESKSLLEPIAASPVIGGPGPATATQLLEELDQLRARKMVTDVEYEEKRKEILKRM